MPTSRKNANAPSPPLRPTTSSASSFPGEASPLQTEQLAQPLADATTDANLKMDILSALREEIRSMFKTELQTALGENLTSIKSELLTVKTQISSDIATMKQDHAALKGTIAAMEHSLSTCTDDIVALRAQVENMTKGMVKLEDKCEDLESRSRRNNIRIVGVPESHVSSCEYVSNLLMEAFALAKLPLVDRAHRSLASKPGPGERPRAIVARLHYYSDCADILRKARELQRINIRDMSISIFPDYTAKTARARAAFNDVRRQLRDMEGVRFGIIHPGKLRITYEGVQRDFTSPGEAKAYIRAMSNPSN